ncbi:YqzL family protein [Virgibacillus halophilus]|uniref:YqzL family protein n=1 Tax=Tigheibacillus halophilus TaxID=361280 RepID=A0ABU5CDS0_9BACI|nr:YqzL family protein [Virgibacillus halophilus]
MIDLTWKVFSETGNIETYLLMKELETQPDAGEDNEIDTAMTNND